MEIEVIKDLIQNLGFPGFVAIYFLVYNHKSMQAMNESIKANSEILKELKLAVQLISSGKGDVSNL